MAKVEILAPFIMSWEKGYNDHKNDFPTKWGITLPTWRAYGWDKNGDRKIDKEDIKLLTEKDSTYILKKRYWDIWKADYIRDQSVANLLVDWYWNSGTKAITLTQEILGVSADGKVGNKTLESINSWTGVHLFTLIWARRKKFIQGLKNYDEVGAGLMRRLQSIQYHKLICNDTKKTEINF